MTISAPRGFSLFGPSGLFAPSRKDAAAAPAPTQAKQAAPAFGFAPKVRNPADPGLRTDSAPRLKPGSGAIHVDSRAQFEALARRDDTPGAPGARELKFLILDVDGPNPKLFFVNTQKHEFHYQFATEGLGQEISLEEFNRLTYFTDARKNLAGSIIAHDAFEQDGKKGLYTMEFWPTDPVGAKHVAKAFSLVKDGLPFAKDQLRYHPSGDTQERLFERDKAALVKAGVTSVDTGTLFKNVKYTPLNPGVGYGVLRVIDANQPDARPPSLRDVVIFKTLPNDLTHVGGVISEGPQTPLSHINLKAKQNDTPNAFVKDAATDPRVAPFIGKLVRYEVGPDGFQLREASQEEAAAWLDKMRPAAPQKPPRDLSVKKIVDVDDLDHGSLNAFGAKVANIGELRNVLPTAMVPDGYGIPFSFYDDFMKANGLYDKAKAMMARDDFQKDPAVREKLLKDFQKELKKAPVPPHLAAQLTALQAKFPPGQPIRCRSSTNNEDLAGFNGAGLYDSYTHRPDEGDLSKTVKQVWASLWNYRAFEEREFHRVDHFSAAMGVMVHRNFDDEQVNGVAVTKNIYDPNWPGFYVNAQVGESLVTNPDPSATPDELLISAIGPNGEWETQYIRQSSLTEGNKRVMTKAQLDQLRQAMEKIQAHFRQVYGAGDDKQFAMDLEFKFDAKGQLFVKQARPWVD